MILEVPVNQGKAKKNKICVFTVTCQKNLGLVGRDSFFLLLSAKPEIVVSDSGISFSKFPVSRHLLKLFYDELCSFSTFFALNFDKKLVVEQIKHRCWLNNKNGYPNSV